MKNVLLEALVIAVAGGLVAFAANSVSPRGLKLTRNFFGAGAAVPAPAPVTNTPLPAAASSVPQEVAARLQAKGLSLADSNQVVQLFHDPRMQQSLVLFIDARNETHYQQGHIPGAYELDYYHPEAYLATLLPLCQVAQTIVVYCTGGECEDSELAATFLVSAGIPKEKVLVYGGGITEWISNGLPVETGSRLSGQIQLPPKDKAR